MEIPGGTCYYDCGLLVDDDDTMHIVYGNTNVSIAQLSADGFSQVKSQTVFSGPLGKEGIEGKRLYKINGTYYVLDDWPSGTTFIWQSSSIWGPWTSKEFRSSIQSPLPGGRLLDQGSLVQGPNGQWYFISFSWSYPAGRIPIMAPIEWDLDGWPSLVEVDGTWGKTYPFPAPSSHNIDWNWTGIDAFQGQILGPAWEWNFSPNTTKFAVHNGLTLYTATVTDDLYAARNTLTHRSYGANPVGTVEIDISTMVDGDRCGFATFHDQSSWIEIQRIGSAYHVSMV